MNKRKVAAFLYRFWSDEEGQAITEYILLLSLSIAGTVALAKGLIATLDKVTLTIGGQLEKDLKTGRAPLGVWTN